MHEDSHKIFDKMTTETLELLWNDPLISDDHKLVIDCILDARASNTTESEPSENEGKTFARLYTNNLCLTTLTMQSLSGEKADFAFLADSLIEQIRKMIDEGPRKAEGIMAANALTLNALFHKMIRNASNTDSSAAVQAYCDIAFRAQDQMRKTLVGLEQMKNPKQNTYVAQQNVAQIQQVNNNARQDPKNELIREVQNETLESRRKEDTISTNPQVQTMAALYRPKDE